MIIAQKAISSEQLSSHAVLQVTLQEVAVFEYGDSREAEPADREAIENRGVYIPGVLELGCDDGRWLGILELENGGPA